MAFLVRSGGAAMADPPDVRGATSLPSPPALQVPIVSAPAVGAYTLQKSLDLGLTQNPTLRVADERVATAAARYRQQQSQRNLQFVIADKTTLQEKQTSNFGPLTITTLDALSTQVNASLQLLLTTFGRVENQVAAAFLQIGVESENARTTRSNLVYQVKNAFFSRLKAQASVDVATMNLQVGRQSLAHRSCMPRGRAATTWCRPIAVTEATEQLDRSRIRSR